MPMRIKVQFTCEDGSVCVPNKGVMNWMEWSVGISTDPFSLGSDLKRDLPPDWDRGGYNGALRCNLCAKGPPNLGTVGTRP